jgi:hypothetical protein
LNIRACTPYDGRQAGDWPVAQVGWMHERAAPIPRPARQANHGGHFARTAATRIFGQSDAGGLAIGGCRVL